MSAVRWVDHAGALAALIDEVAAVAAYAIDTEFLRERTYYPRLALIQIAWDGHIALIDPLAVDVRPLASLLTGDGVAVFHAADQDLEVLDIACGVLPKRMFDTQLAAGFLGLSTPSLVTLAERVLGIHLSKGDRLTDWTIRPLTDAQKHYAASDVAHLLEIRDRQLDQLAASGRIAWVEEECELLRSRPRGHPIPEHAWWRLKDGRILRGRDRLVAQEVCAWRERRAAVDDKPVRFVLPDLAVLAIAQSKPQTFEDMAGLRGIDGRYLRGGAGQELLQTVARGVGMSLSELQLPEPEDFDRRLRPALTLVSAWVAQLARDVLIDPTLLATRSDLVEFLRNDPDARLAHGWRAEMVGTAVRQLVSGEAALAFEPDGTLVLESRSRQRLGPAVTIPTAAWAGE